MAAAGAVVPSRRRPRYTRPASDPCEVTVADTPKPTFSPEVLTRSVWDAV